MVSPDYMLTGLRNPSKAARFLKQRYVLGPPVLGRLYGPGRRVMDEDWDTLVVLDGCRYDVFAEQRRLQGTLEPAMSVGSNTVEFLQKNFGTDDFPDVSTSLRTRN